jgi:hypothetical protein
MKQLRNFYQLFLLISLSISFVGIGLKTVAQNQTNTQDTDTILNEKNKPYPKHEIGFSVGVFTIMGLIVSPNTGWESLESFPIIRHTYCIEWNDREYEKMYNLGSYTLNYNYHRNSKHSFGISLSWIGKHIETYWIYYPQSNMENNIPPDTVDGSGWKHYFTLQGNYRHTYYRKNKISLYWGIYGGITLCVRDKDILPKETTSGFLGTISNVKYYFSPIAIHLNTFGMELGEKYVFSMELGVGTQGFFKMGFKYKY